MKSIKYFATIAATLFAAIAVYAQPGCDLKPTQTFLLYPEGQNVEKGLEGALGPGESNGHWEITLRDVQNAFRFCRANASRWGVNQIGVMGFSAGGHLAACTSNMFTDEITRPDFSILIYPVITMEWEYTHKGTRNNLLGKDECWDDQELKAELVKRYSMEKNVTAATPQTFLAHSTDDKGVPVINSINYYNSLIENGVSAEMHIYPTGGHGWGFNKDIYIGKGKDKLGYARPEFEASLKRWLESIRK